MTWQDLVNGCFEGGMAFVIFLSIRRVLADRKVAGISLVTIAFVTAWGIWNLYYYPHLGQTLSWAAGVAVMAANGIWLALLGYYTRWPGGAPSGLSWPARFLRHQVPCARHYHLHPDERCTCPGWRWPWEARP